jgi:hypothetical protein
VIYYIIIAAWAGDEEQELELIMRLRLGRLD